MASAEEHIIHHRHTHLLRGPFCHGSALDSLSPSPRGPRSGWRITAPCQACASWEERLQDDVVLSSCIISTLPQSIIKAPYHDEVMDKATAHVDWYLHINHYSFLVCNTFMTLVYFSNGRHFHRDGEDLDEKLDVHAWSRKLARHMPSVMLTSDSHSPVSDRNSFLKHCRQVI